MPHVVPVATLLAGLGLLGGAVSGIHQIGSNLHGAAATNQVRQQRIDYVRLTSDRPGGHHCLHPGPQGAPPAPSSLQ
jgi:hypothetical protein